MRTFVSLAAAATVLSFAVTMGSASSQAVPFNFFQIGGGGDDVGEQLIVDVTDFGDGRVSFLFDNLGPVPSSITNIYFDDGTLLGISELNSHADVSFVQGGNPSDLPGGNSLDPPFNATVEFNTSVEQNTADGVEVGQWLEILFNLQGVQDFNDTIAALLSGALRIGLQVRGIGDSGDSAQFVNNPTPIPLPAGLVLFLSGLAGIGFLGRYKARRRETAAA
jgi:hypothetical protein